MATLLQVLTGIKRCREWSAYDYLYADPNTVLPLSQGGLFAPTIPSQIIDVRAWGGEHQNVASRPAMNHS